MNSKLLSCQQLTFKSEFTSDSRIYLRCREEGVPAADEVANIGVHLGEKSTSGDGQYQGSAKGVRVNWNDLR